MDAPAKMCVRVAKNSGGWFIAQGTLPDRPSGASGSGARPPPPHTHVSTPLDSCTIHGSYSLFPEGLGCFLHAKK